jgi:hypothetical protein
MHYECSVRGRGVGALGPISATVFHLPCATMIGTKRELPVFCRWKVTVARMFLTNCLLISAFVGRAALAQSDG